MSTVEERRARAARLMHLANEAHSAVVRFVEGLHEVGDREDIEMGLKMLDAFIASVTKLRDKSLALLRSAI